jgi:type VI secretion system secreted protein VgrG
MNILSQLTSALSLFGAGPSQHARLITLSAAQDSTLPEALMAEQFSGREAVNELFHFDVDALSVSTVLDLSAFIGEEITLGLLQADGQRRSWHGLCTDAAWLGADGGIARYRLRLEPALTLLRLRRDSFIFQDQDVRGIVTTLLADYPQVRFDFDVTQTLTVRPICTQYRESDFDFLTRLLAEEGLNWRFEHEQPELTVGGSSSSSDDNSGGAAEQHSKHTLVIFDSQATAPVTAGAATLRFHGVRATDSADAIDQFGTQRQVLANAVTLSSWDPAQLVAPATEHSGDAAGATLPALALYHGGGERRYADTGAADAHGQRMLQALELQQHTYLGGGGARQLAAGARFQLLQHGQFADGANDFTVLSVNHAGRNNMGTGLISIATTGWPTTRPASCARGWPPAAPPPS